MVKTPQIAKVLVVFTLALFAATSISEILKNIFYCLRIVIIGQVSMAGCLFLPQSLISLKVLCSNGLSVQLNHRCQGRRFFRCFPADTAISLCFLCCLDFVVNFDFVLLKVYSVIVVQQPYTHFLCTEAFPLNSCFMCQYYRITFFVLPFVECSLCCLCYKQVRIVSIIPIYMSRGNY